MTSIFNYLETNIRGLFSSPDENVSSSTEVTETKPPEPTKIIEPVVSEPVVLTGIPFLTVDKLKKCMPENRKIFAWHPVFQEHLPKYEINTPKRVAGFLSQTANESIYYTTYKENLNYSASRLLVIFKKYFDSASAAKYARHPEMIANRVYANRIGNGPESSGDGWKYRGRGAIQTTGRANYAECSEFIYGDKSVLLDNPDLLSQTNGIVLSAIWYWSTRNLNSFADNKDIKGMTKKINGGYHGLDDRIMLFNRMYDILS